MNVKELKGQVAFITGGSKGIGYGIAAALMQAGLNVALTSREATAAAQAAAQLSKDYEGEALGIAADVRDYGAQEKAVAACLEKFGRIDLVIANAGLGHFAPVDQMEIADWQQVIDTNVNGVFYSLRASVEALKKTQGYFISISSLAGTNFFAQGSAYNASKFAVTGFSQAAMLDLRQYGIRVTTIMPGSVTSYFNGHQPNDSDHWKIQPEDLGQMVLDLLRMHPRSLPSKIEIRPSQPPSK